MTTERSGALAMSGGLAAEHAREALADALDVRIAHLRVEGKRHGLARDALGDRELPLVEALLPEKRRQVDRLVRDADADPVLRHRVDERLARPAQGGERQEHREHVPAVTGI